jgi:hypothetical protein
MVLLKIKGSITFGLALAAIVFFTSGDKFLPQPLSGWSYSLRTGTVNWISGIFDPSNRLDPNEARQEQIEQLEGK